MAITLCVALRVMLGIIIDLAAAQPQTSEMPVEFLQNLGLHDLPLGGVGIPYRDGSGQDGRK